MTSNAIDVLKTSLKTEQSNLVTMRDDTKRERELGERMQREVDAQVRIVSDIEEAIALLEQARRGQNVEATE
jgi:hypothetical protein